MKRWRVKIVALPVEFDGVVKAPNAQRAIVRAMDMAGMDFFCPRSVGKISLLRVEEWLEVEQQELEPAVFWSLLNTFASRPKKLWDDIRR